MIHGSSIWSMRTGSGMSTGLCRSSTSAVGQMDAIDDRRRGGDQIEIELALQPLLDDLEMQQAEKAAAEAEAQRRRGLGLVLEARVVEAQLGEAVAQLLVIGGVGREQAAEHHRLHRLEAGQRRGGRAALLGDGVADLAIGDGLDAGGDEADLAGAELVGTATPFGREDADALDLCDGAGRHHADLLAGLQHAVLDPHQDDDAEIGVVPAIDQQRLQRRRGVALGRRQARHQRLEHALDVEPGLGRDLDRVRRVEADHVLDLLLDPRRARRPAGRSCSAPARSRARRRSPDRHWRGSAPRRPGWHRPPAASPRRRRASG